MTWRSNLELALTCLALMFDVETCSFPHGYLKYLVHSYVPTSLGGAWVIGYTENQVQRISPFRALFKYYAA